jgi:hypothetical protein
MVTIGGALLAHLAPLQMSDTREDSVYLAKLAEQAERYEGKLCHVCT